MSRQEYEAEDGKSLRQRKLDPAQRLAAFELNGPRSLIYDSALGKEVHQHLRLRTKPLRRLPIWYQWYRRLSGWFWPNRPLDADVRRSITVYLCDDRNDLNIDEAVLRKGICGDCSQLIVRRAYRYATVTLKSDLNVFAVVERAGGRIGRHQVSYFRQGS
jgi:hypothetical protein